jgi:AraC-like DNA-binding protein
MLTIDKLTKRLYYLTTMNSLSKSDIDPCYRYRVPKPDNRKWGLVVTTAGYSHIPSSSPYPQGEHPDTHMFTWDTGRVLNESHLVYINKGRGVFESKRGGKHKIAAGMLMVVFKNEWHRYKPDPETGWDEYWIGVDGTTADAIFAPPFFFPKSPIIPIEDNHEFTGGLFNLIQTVNEQPDTAGPVLSAKLMHLISLIYIHQQHEGNERSPIQKKINQAAALISERYNEEIDLEQLARDLGLSYTKFRRDFKNQTGLAPSQYQNHTRMEHAKALINYSNLSIHEIAAQTGVDSPAYFSRAFKKHFNQSPSDLRK